MVLNGILGLIGLVCAVWVIYDVWTIEKSLKQNHKIIWTIVAIFFSIITAIVYYFMVKKK
jgi:prolipoprotein diacylglyceryltransferase